MRRVCCLLCPAAALPRNFSAPELQRADACLGVVPGLLVSASAFAIVAILVACMCARTIEVDRDRHFARRLAQIHYQLQIFVIAPLGPLPL